MITEQDFQKTIEATYDNESAAEACFKLAQAYAAEENSAINLLIHLLQEATEAQRKRIDELAKEILEMKKQSKHYQ